MARYRTHMAAEITADMDGQEVIVAGWVHIKRDLGGKKFLVLRDSSGTIQLIFSKGKTPKHLIEVFSRLTRESAISVRGRVKRSPKAPRGVEIEPIEIKVLSRASPILPLDVTGKVPADMDTRLNARVLDLRRPKVQAMFKIRDCVLRAIREALRAHGFMEVHTPKIIATATEGGAQLFPVLYFGKEAFLAQSPQLYKELLAGALERVYEIGPAYRAEESDTPYHLSEFISVDIEAAFITYEEAMVILEDVVVNVIKKVADECVSELELLGHKLPEVEKPIPKITYEEALNILRREGLDVEFGDDLGTPELRVLSRHFDSFYFIKDWPTDTRPFYTKPFDDRPEICEAFDLNYKWLEVASGSSRIHDKQMLIEQLRRRGLAPESFEYFLKWFDYGMPPHAGWGLGLERFLTVLTGARNVREVTFFPRDKKRLVP